MADYPPGYDPSQVQYISAEAQSVGALISLGGIVLLGGGLYFAGTVVVADEAVLAPLTIEEQAAAAGMPVEAFKFMDEILATGRNLTQDEQNLVTMAAASGKWIGSAEVVTGLLASMFPDDYNTVARPLKFKHVIIRDAPVITLTTNKPDAQFGDNLSFTATVTGEIAGQLHFSADQLANAITGFPTNAAAALRPTGTVQFTCDGVTLGAPVALNETGVAYSPFITTLAVGTHNIIAAYSGDDNFPPINKLYVQTVAPASTAVYAFAAPNPYSDAHGGALPAFRVTATVLKQSDGSAITSPPGQLRFRVSTDNGASFTTISSKDINTNGSANQDVYVSTGLNLLVRCIYDPTPSTKYLTSKIDFVEKWNAPSSGSFPSEFTIRPTPTSNCAWASGTPGFAASPVLIRDGIFNAQFEITCPNNWTGDVYIPTNVPLVPGNPFMSEYVGGVAVWSGTPSISFNAATFRITNGVGTFTINAVGGRGGTNYALNNFASGLIQLAIRDPQNSAARPTMKWNDRGLIYTAIDTTSLRLGIF